MLKTLPLFPPIPVTSELLQTLLLFGVVEAERVEELFTESLRLGKAPNFILFFSSSLNEVTHTVRHSGKTR